MTTKTEICMCRGCEGRGYTVREELIDYHKRDYSYEEVPCKMCETSGRELREETYTIVFKPYKPKSVIDFVKA